MIVEEIMRTNVYSLKPTNTINDAVCMMRENKIRHIPITDNHNAVVGVITSHDLKTALPSCLKEDSNPAVYETPINKIMSKDVIVGHPLDFVEDVALILFDSKIGCLPIVSGGELVGIVTSTDVLFAYIELTGALKPSSKMDIRVIDKPGVLSDIVEVFKKHHANILSVLLYPDSENENSKIVSIRVQILNPLSIIEDLRNQGFEVLWPNLPGVNL